MSEKNTITESEWRVMEALWQQGGQTTGQLQRALAETGWSRNTVATFLARLEAKGYVCSQGSPKKFYPLQERQACQSWQTEDFLGRVFHGSIGMLMTSFLRDNHLKPQELEQLRQLLDAEEKRQKEG
ncbi:MAG: BlaI/MecI/CopY family transcriptional regulator [Eubacteriales bacterium]|jgi:BlaI family penicillinase repressor